MAAPTGRGLLGSRYLPEVKSEPTFPRTMDPIEEIEFLTNSPNRFRVLRRLGAAEPLALRDIDETVDATRRTVTRTLSTLGESGYVLRDADGYRLTAKGSYLADRLDAVVADVERIVDVEPVLANLPASVFDLDPSYLADGEVLVAPERSPYAILDRALELRRNATRIHELAPGVEGKSISQLADRIRSGDDVEGEIIVPPGAMEAAESHPDYRGDHRVNAAAGTIDFFVYPEPPDLYLGIFDETVALAATEDDRPRAMVVSDATPVFEWAIETFGQFRADAAGAEAV